MRHKKVKTKDQLRAEKAKSIRKQLAFISLFDIWPAPAKVEYIPSALRAYRDKRRRKNRAARATRRYNAR